MTYFDMFHVLYFTVKIAFSVTQSKETPASVVSTRKPCIVNLPMKHSQWKKSEKNETNILECSDLSSTLKLVIP